MEYYKQKASSFFNDLKRFIYKLNEAITKIVEATDILTTF